ncbi:SGNH/GDSL hydrolase family protein [Neptuniibacter sp. CAU 1671]|uniref:SGNH/GDSL hydrolase family protein n=1 Tax=Neptuniibacter sp. CAU 1671 TaxID=3032593 RepID=UPI0023DC8E93|nr:SGNH/GDSL hydrolase family protein [Neptuniibacter sp. CAU 1671]MDF2181955.1 SGNH/GDSL hydrolase family protein [Neptuniibacter sp. CAU 1671]
MSIFTSSFKHSLCLFLLIQLASTASASPEARVELSQAEESLTPLSTVNPDAFRVLFIGNSITRHGVKENIGWHHVSGMAASEENKDYVHILASKLRNELSPTPVDLYNHTGGSGSVIRRFKTIDQVLVVRPNLVVIQLGEHEKPETGLQNIRDAYHGLVRTVTELQTKPIVICVGPWAGLIGNYGNEEERMTRAKLEYSGFKGQVQGIMRDVCERHGSPFVSVADLTLEPNYFGFGDTWGVRWHPNDRAHAMYADRIYRAFNKVRR